MQLKKRFLNRIIESIQTGGNCLKFILKSCLASGTSGSALPAITADPMAAGLRRASCFVPLWIHVEVLHLAVSAIQPAASGVKDAQMAAQAWPLLQEKAAHTG